MQQTIQVTIPVPETNVLINKEEYNDLITQQLNGRVWNMKQLEAHTDRSAQWLREKVLYPNKKELDIANGGFVKFPNTHGAPWKFGALRMSEWLENNLEVVL